MRTILMLLTVCVFAVGCKNQAIVVPTATNPGLKTGDVTSLGQPGKGGNTPTTPPK